MKQSKRHRIYLWITGRPLKSNTHSAMEWVYPTLWEWSPVGDLSAISVRTVKAPCFLHRWMQRMILGINYRMLPIDS